MTTATDSFGNYDSRDDINSNYDNNKISDSNYDNNDNWQ